MTETNTAADSGLVTFAEFFDAIAARATIYGETRDGHRQFRTALMKSLTPYTPYERAVAENLVAIEWEILQKRHMLDAIRRDVIEGLLTTLILKHAEECHEHDLDEAWSAFEADGGSEDDWDPEPFDKESVTREARDLAKNALSNDLEVAMEASRTLRDMGVDAVLVMAEAQLKLGKSVLRIDEDIRILERRRREVNKDYKTLKACILYAPARIQ